MFGKLSLFAVEILQHPEANETYYASVNVQQCQSSYYMYIIKNKEAFRKDFYVFFFATFVFEGCGISKHLNAA